MRNVDDALDRLEGCITRVKDGVIVVGRTSEEDADAALATVREALDARMTRESGQALIEDANRWERAYRQARDESERLREAKENGDRLLSQAGRQLEAAETEIERLRQLLDEEKGRTRAAADLLAQAEKIVPGLITTAGSLVVGDVAEARERAEAAEAENQRLTEGLREIADDYSTTDMDFYVAWMELKGKARALLAASPSGGGGA